jgi:Tat protein secretion system quality control protein TatD with DNase activity
MGDRSGGREPKGASLKKSKKNPGAPAAKVKKQPKLASSGPSTSLPPPMPTGDELYFDCGAAILSRQFDRDRERMLIRAKTEGNCSVVISWFSDIEKQLMLADLCKVNTGFCYFVTGVHPDNIDGMNKKAHETWLEKTEELGKRAECVGIMSGLNLFREMKTHFAQESLLKSSCELAEKLLLPLILHIPDSNSLERALEVLREIGWTDDESADNDTEDGSHRVLIHDIVTSCGGNVDKMKLALAAGCYGMVSAAGLTDPDAAIKERAVECVRIMPLSKLLVCSDSPWKTPQNLPDIYLRSLRNEPANLPYVVEALASAMGHSKDELAIAIKANSLLVFGMEFINMDPGMKPPSSFSSSSSAAVDNAAPAAPAHQNESKAKHVAKQIAGDGSLVAETSLKSLSIADNQPAVSTSNTATDAAAKESSTKHSSFYGCLRCRLRLFSQSEVKVHGIDAIKAVFKTGGEHGLCKATIFVGCSDNKEISSRTGVLVRGSNAECKECGTKLGKYSSGESFCACGAAVAGPSVRIQSSKVDFFDESLDTKDLVARSLLEAEEAHRDALFDEEEDRNRDSKKSKRKKKIRSDNKGNFSDYRNKSFRPNASRVKKGDEAGAISEVADEEEDVAEEVVESKEKEVHEKASAKKAEQVAVSDDEESDEDEEDD